jgi:hypothetical protein
MPLSQLLKSFPGELNAELQLILNAIVEDLKAVRISDLSTGMILQEDIRTKVDVLLAGHGQEVTYPLIVRLHSFHQRRDIPDQVLVLAPSS